MLTAIAAAAFGVPHGAHAEKTGSPPPAAGAAAHSAADNKATVARPDPQIDTANIVKRLNEELGINLEATTTGWQHALDRLEGDLGRSRHRYSDLNQYRDELQRIRSETDNVINRIQPRLDADRAQVKLLGPAPAANQPPEPEQAALGRAELNYHLGLLSAGQAAANSTNLRIENLFNAIQDIRRKNFASSLFQPIPGVYAHETWANLLDYVPLATGRLRDLIADWWRDTGDRGDIARVAVEALLMSLLLAFAGWHGVPQVAALARGRRAAILAACVFGGRSDCASSASGRRSHRFLVRHDSQRPGVTGTHRLAVLFDGAIDRDRVHGGGSCYRGICPGRTAMAAY